MFQAIAACETFKVNQQHVSEGVYTGSLALKHSVQYKTKSKYTLILQAVVRANILWKTDLLL